VLWQWFTRSNGWHGGTVAVAVLCRELPPREFPVDRLLYGARSVRPNILLLPHGESDGCEAAFAGGFDVPSVSLLLPPVYGRPHPQSAIEQRLYKMIEADAELRSKFVFNARIEDVSLKSPKVDPRCHRPRSGARCAEPRFELLTMRTIVDPFARGGDPLAGGNGCGMADHGHHLSMPARFCSQNAEAVLGVVVRDALDEAGQHFLS
jgi:hypothetical protein